MTLPTSGSIGLSQVLGEFGTASLGTSLRGNQVTITPATSNIPSTLPVELTDFYGSTSVRYGSFSITPNFIDSGHNGITTVTSRLALTKANDWTDPIDFTLSVGGAVASTGVIPVGNTENITSVTNPSSSYTVGNDPVVASTTWQTGTLTAPSTVHECRFDWQYNASVGIEVPQPGVQLDSSVPITVTQPPISSVPAGVQVNSPLSVANPPTPCTNCAPGTTPTPPTPGVSHPSFAGGACQTGFTFADCVEFFTPTGQQGGCGGCSVANPPTPCTNCAPGTTPTPDTVFPAGECHSFDIPTCNAAGGSGCANCDPTFSPGPSITLASGECFTGFTIADCAAGAFATTAIPCTACDPTGESTNSSGIVSNVTNIEAQAALDGLPEITAGTANTIAGTASNSSCPSYSITANIP